MQQIFIYSLVIIQARTQNMCYALLTQQPDIQRVKNCAYQIFLVPL